MNRILYLLLLLTGFQTGFCQTETPESEDNLSEINRSEKAVYKRFAIGISGGIGSFVDRDRIISNFAYSGKTSPFGFYFLGRKPSSKSILYLVLGNMSSLKTSTNKGFSYKGELGESFPDQTDGLDLSTLKTSFFDLGYTKLFLLRKTETKSIQAFLGYDLRTTGFTKTFLQFEYTNKLTERITSLAFAFGLEKNFNLKHQLSYQLILPFLSYGSRILTNSESEPSTITANKITILRSIYGFDNSLTYRYQLSSRFSCTASYSVRYLCVTFPEKDTWASTQGNVGFFFHF